MRIGRFICVVVESDIEEDSNLSQYDIHLYQFGIINSFEESFSDGFKILRISLNNKQIAFIILSINDEIINYESISDKCTNILDIIKNCFGFTVTVAISDEGIGPMALIKKYGICRDALKFKFYIGDNSIISYKDLNSFYKYEDYSPLEKNQELLLEGIKTGNESVVKKELAEIFLFMKGKESNIEYVKNFYQKVITTINNIRMSVIVTDIDKPIENKELNSLYKFMKKCDNIKELNDILEEIAIRITLRVNLLNNKKIKLALQKALDYIHENYTEQITLSQVAQQIYLSSFYLSRLFKKEMGKNFVDYLNEIRVEKAKELLKDIKYKSYEIAEMVGIPDAHYFSKLFKKYVGMAPTEYRDSHII